MSIILDGTKGETFPSWTTAGRPATPNAGQTGYNTTLNTLERYNGTTWGPIVTTADTGTVSQTMLASGVVGNGPAFSAYASAAQTVTLATATKVNINTEKYDTDSCFDTTTYRFTPNVAGYYQIEGTVIGIAATTFTSILAYLYKNGAAYKRTNLYATLSTGTSTSLSVSDIVYLNGSTDYVELWAAIGGSGTATLNSSSPSSSFSSFFSGALVRSA